MNTPTPGPWTICTDARGQHYAWIEAGGAPVARVVTARDETDGYTTGYIPAADRIETDPQALATARLIAAAPDLLATCELLRSFWKDPDSDVQLPTILRAVTAATAKARGEVPA